MNKLFIFISCIQLNQLRNKSGLKIHDKLTYSGINLLCQPHCRIDNNAAKYVEQDIYPL